MKLRFGKAVVKHRVFILITAFLLLIPAVIGYISTRVNYDILSYLPGNIDTMKGQEIMVDQFGAGGFSLVVTEGMKEKEIAATKQEIESVDQVGKVIWYDTFSDISVPMEILPNDVYEVFNHDDASLMMVIFKDTTSSDATMEAIEELREIVGKNCFISGMSAVVTDTKNLVEQEVPDVCVDCWFVVHAGLDAYHG